MTEIRFVNVNRREIAPPIRTRKKRLDLIVAAHTARYGGGDRVLVSVHKRGDILAPTSESIYFPSIPDEARPHERDDFAARLYGARRVEKGEIVLVTVLPAGGGRNSGAKIGMTVAMIALIVFAQWAGPALAGSMATAGVISAANVALTGKIITAGIVIGGGAIMSAIMRSGQKDSKIYGVTGGGNVPRPNDRIPFGYGEYWNPADLSQPDYYRYQNETDTILFKRVVLGAGKYKLKGIRVGNTTFWTGDLSPNGGITTSGITSAFPNCRFELLYGQASTLVPSSVITSSNVTGQTIPLSSDVNPILGPFAVNPIGTTINRIQVDYSTPSGYSRNGHETTRDLWFEYAPIDNAGNPTAAWQTLYRNSRPLYTTKALRWSEFLSVPAGRYAVRVRNNRAKIDDGDNVDIVWDALRGYTPDTIVRENLTEVAIEVRSSKDLGVTSFADMQFLQERVGPVWNGTTFTEQPIRKCVDAYADLLRDSHFGGGIDDTLIDFGRLLSYRTAVTEYDTFDGQIRGPTSLWEAAKTILSNMRAEPVQIGPGFSFVRDEPQSIRRHTFTRRQIVRGSLSMDFAVEADDGSAHVEVTFNTDADPKQPNGAEAYYGVPSIFGPRRIEWQGVSSYEHATHLARWMAASGFYRRGTIAFETELSGRLIKRGDPIAVDPWFVDSRAAAGVVSRSGNTLTLDVDVTIATGDRAMLRDREGREWGPVRVTQGASVRQIVLNSSDVSAEESDTGVLLTDVLAPDSLQPTAVLIGPLADLGEQWLVQSMLPAEKGRTRITAKLDSAAVYTAIDEAIDPQDPLTWTLTPVEAPAVTNLRANVVQHTSSLAAQWSVTAQNGAVRYEVQIAYADDQSAWETVYAGASPTGEAPIRYLETEEPVFVRARAFGATGLTEGWVTSAGIIAPKPIVTAEVPWTALDTATATGLTVVAERLQAARDLVEQLSAQVQSLEQSLLDQGRVIVRQVVSIQGQASARLLETYQVLANADGAISSTLTALSAQVNDPTNGLPATRATLLSFQSAQATTNSSTATSLSNLTASYNGISASGQVSMVAVAGSGGYSAFYEVRLSAGTSAPAAFRMTVDSGGRSGVDFFAARLRVLRPSDGATVLGWDSLLGVLTIFSGTFVAGVVQSQDGNFVIDLNNKTIEMWD